MSVLIKGVEMPKFCAVCKIADWEYDCCPIAGRRAIRITDTSGRPDFCPLIPVPPHGDLIDREAWRKSLIDEGEIIGIYGFSIDGLSVDDVCCAIENAPVIIPAERSD